jgi:hypothetical protein
MMLLLHCEPRFTQRSLKLSGLLAGLLAVAAPVASHGDEPSPLLAQLNRETQSLYTNVQSGVVRLQMPAPRWLNEMAAADDPVRKWGTQLTPSVRDDLIRQRQLVEQGLYQSARRVIPATQPKGGEGESWEIGQYAVNGTITAQSTGPNGTQAIQIRTGGGIDSNGEIDQPLGPTMSFLTVGSFAPNNIGLVLDGQGHVLVPMYIEKETVGDGVKASVGNGTIVNATFVSSDRQSNLSVLKLPESSGKPVKIANQRPAEGSLVMLLAPNAGTAKLILWAGDKSDLMGLVVSVDGAVGGFARGNGQFLPAGMCKPVADQLIQYGLIKRAKLGMEVLQVGPSDPTREQWQALGSRPALRVLDVANDSTAAKAGLKKGDVITTLAGLEVGDPTSLASVLAGRAGATPVKALRDGQPIDFKMELAPE